MSDVAYTAPPTLAAMLKSNAFVRAAIGPVGSGKSSACIIEIVRRAVTQAPGPDKVRRTRFAVIRNTYSQLRDTTRKTFEQWLPPGMGQWHEQPFTYEIDKPLKDGTRVHCEVLFRALDRPEDVQKLLSLELTGAYINEAREMPKHVLDVLQTRVGRFPSKAQGGPSWFGIWMDTNPWPTSHWGYELFSKEKPEGFALFEQPGGREPNAENVDNLPAGYYQRLCHGKDAEWVAEYVDGKYPSSDRGSVYGDLIDGLERRGGIGEFQHPRDGVFAVFDLGVSDATSIWWWRLNEHGMPDFVDWYEATGKGMSHYFEVLESRNLELSKIYLPHDSRARTFQTGVSTLDQFLQRYPGKVAVGPELSIEDGLAAGRWLLEQPVRFHARCDEGLKRLRAYRYVWDEVKKVFSKKPLHDYSSHTADSFRYSAQVAKAAWELTRPKPDAKKPPPARDMNSFTLNELFEMNESHKPRGRI